VITPYLSKTATLRAFTGYDRTGSPNYDERTIRVRWEGRRALVRDAQGNQVVSEARFYTDSPVTSGDTIVDLQDNEWTAISVSEHETLSGEVSHYEVYL
jgi:hypothetical protein